MIPHAFFLLVTCIATLSSAIRVDWNTNKGPIVPPPPPRPSVRPRPPFRQPAPVWEAQSNDLPNPNPYVYVLPPPSRPRPATSNYLTSDRLPVTATNYNEYSNHKNHGSILSAANVNAYRPAGGNAANALVVVAALAPKYLPHLGRKYYAVVPLGGKAASYSSAKPAGYSFADKLQGKFNVKTKKYKVYEKVKHNPLQPNYSGHFGFHRPQQEEQETQSHPETWLHSQQLPVLQPAKPFNIAEPAKLRLQQEQQTFAFKNEDSETSEIKVKKEQKIAGSSFSAQRTENLDSRKQR